MKTKQYYQKKLSTYKIRREEARSSLKHLTKKIAYLTKRVKEVEDSPTKSEYNTQILLRRVEEFVGHSLKEKSKDSQLGRSLYYKWGLENGYDGRVMMKMLKIGSKSAAWTSRLRFTRKLGQGAVKEREIWNSFKSFMEDC